MKKSLITLSVVGAMALSLAACGGRKNTNHTVAKTPVVVDKPDSVGGDPDGSAPVAPLAQDEGLAVLEEVLGRLNPEIAKKSTLFDKYKENFESAASQDLLAKVSSMNFTLTSVKDDVTEPKDDIKKSSLLLIGEDEKVLKYKYELDENAKVSREAFLTGKTPELKVVNTESTDNKMRIFAGCSKDCTQVGVIGYFPDEKNAAQYFGLVFKLNASSQYDLIFTTHKTKKIDDYKKAGVTSKCDAAKDFTCVVAVPTEESCQIDPSDEKCKDLLGGVTSEKYKNAVASFCSDDSNKAQVICKSDTTTTAATDTTTTDTTTTDTTTTDTTTTDTTTTDTTTAATDTTTTDTTTTDTSGTETKTTDTTSTTATTDEEFDFNRLEKTEQLQQCDDNIMSHSQCQTIGGVDNETGAQQSYSLEVKEQCGTADPSNMTDEQVKQCDAALMKIDKAMYDAKMKAKQTQKTTISTSGRDAKAGSAGGR